MWLSEGKDILWVSAVLLPQTTAILFGDHRCLIDLPVFYFWLSLLRRQDRSVLHQINFLPRGNSIKSDMTNMRSVGSSTINGVVVGFMCGPAGLDCLVA